MSDVGSCSVCGRLCSGGLCEESPCPSAWEHDEPRREPGPWMWSGCTEKRIPFPSTDPVECVWPDENEPRPNTCTAQDAEETR